MPDAYAIETVHFDGDIQRLEACHGYDEGEKAVASRNFNALVVEEMLFSD